MSIIFLICLIMGIVYVKRKELELIEQVTPITRGEWSERRVVLNLLKGGINPKAIFHGKHSNKCTFYTLRFVCSFAASNTIKPQLL